MHYSTSKKPIWLLFKVVELIMSIACSYTHIQCFDRESFPHIFLLCGTFGGSTIACSLAIVGLILAERPTLRLEAMISGLYGVLHLITVYVSMYVAEKDKHLCFLLSLEEKQHQYFVCCRRTAILALYTAAIYIMHCTLAVDLKLSHVMVTVVDGNVVHLQLRKHKQRSKRPLKLYFISMGADHYLNKFACYRSISSNIIEDKQRRGSKVSGTLTVYMSESSEPEED
ncbi:uncharacterized protein LOC115634636 [Scaptodrosophila lebanonensis]|uniref:Uncharacterized protein LOC115634636 n=1 Tax=Drosophila lebanonensis TaxID=7225 RepID=A0A6J2UM94_DROLE|nr:uncharacterized protein LOC115634636 [Scaptodrosophila lebanonensis]